MVAGPFMVVTRHHLTPVGAALTIAAAVVIGGLQLRHSFATGRGERPAGALVTLLVLTVLVYVPIWWFSWDWAVMQWFVVASAAMVLPRWPAVAAVVVPAPILGHALVAGWLAAGEGTAPGLLVAGTVYHFTLLAMGSAGLYGSAKAFVSNVTRGMAKELIGDGVRVNAVAPGFIATPFHDRYSTPAQVQAAITTIPQGRVGVAEDCVGAYLFLASDILSGYIIGQVIEVNGGQLMP